MPGMKTEATLLQDGSLGSGNLLTASGLGQGGGSFSSTQAFSSAPAFLSDPIEQPKPGRSWGGPNYCWGTQGFPSVAARQKCLGDPQRNYSVLGCNSGNLAVGLWSRAWESVFQQPRPRWWTRVPGGPPRGLLLLSQPHTSFSKHTWPMIDSLPFPSQPSGSD